MRNDRPRRHHELPGQAWKHKARVLLAFALLCLAAAFSGIGFA